MKACPSPIHCALQAQFRDLFLGLIEWGAPMTSQIFANTLASISELKANPMKVVASGLGMPIAVLNRNEPAFYCVPAKVYEAMLELIEDRDLLAIATARADEESISVSIDEL